MIAEPPVGTRSRRALLLGLVAQDTTQDLAGGGLRYRVGAKRRKGANRSWTKSASAIQRHRTGPTVTAPMIPWTPCRRNSSMIEKRRQTVRDAAVDAQWDASEDEGATWRKDFDLTFERESRVANG